MADIVTALLPETPIGVRSLQVANVAWGDNKHTLINTLGLEVP